MLAPLIIDLLMTCTLFLVAGWAYDFIGRWFEAERPLAGSVVPGALGHMGKAMPSVLPRARNGWVADDSYQPDAPARVRSR